MPATNAMNMSRRTVTPGTAGEEVVVGTGKAVAVVVGTGKQRSALMNLFLCVHQHERILYDTNSYNALYYLEFLYIIQISHANFATGTHACHNCV